jgi:hypothetical protein
MTGTIRWEQLDDGNVGRVVEDWTTSEVGRQIVGSAWSFGDILEGDHRHKRAAPMNVNVLAYANCHVYIAINCTLCRHDGN